MQVPTDLRFNWSTGFRFIFYCAAFDFSLQCCSESEIVSLTIISPNSSEYIAYIINNNNILITVWDTVTRTFVCHILQHIIVSSLPRAGHVQNTYTTFIVSHRLLWSRRLRVLFSNNSFQ